jgi:hypothetical protein
VPNDNLELCVFSNLNVPDKLWNRYTGRIKELQQAGKIKYFDLTASIDCWGQEAEYARFGLNLKKFEERLAWASEQKDWLVLNVSQTITCLTMHSMPELIKKIDYYSKKDKDIGHDFQFYVGPSIYQHPQIFAFKKWEETFRRIYEVMPTKTPRQQEAILRMQGLEKQLQLITKNNVAEIKKLHIYLDELDRRRNTNWRKIFPYLENFE